MSSILVVDDEEDVVVFLTTVLSAEGFAVRSASSAMEALLQIQKEKPRVILLDLMMPQVSGEELCRIIKNDPDLFDIHIIILSARFDLDTKVSCFDGGADEYLVKPIHPKELVARMKSFFRLLRGMSSSSRPRSSSTADMRGATTLDIGPDVTALSRIKPKYGNFRVDSLVGSGGMGHVFKGYDEVLERPVGIKVLSRSLSASPSFVERFRREGKTLASIEHPGIASIYSFGEEEGVYYFAMQWCAGGSVLDLLRRKERLELLTAIDITLQCIDALSAAFAKGIVHRDIKPNNLMFDQNQWVKIVDFGLATAEKHASHITQASELFGTPDYMAPEQAQFGIVDHRADIYALGITLYRMLYGKLPFNARSPIEMVVKHASEAFPAYDPLEGAVPREVYDIIERMTQKAVRDRYQDYPSCRRDLVQLRNELFSSTGVLLPEVSEMAPSPVWKTENLIEILSALHISPHSGVLEVRGEKSLTFLVENRYILFLKSPDVEEKLWDLLVENRFLKKEDTPPPGSNFQDCLMRFLIKQAFSLEDLKKVHRSYLKSQLMEVGRWKEFEGEFYTGTVINDDIGGAYIGDVLLELAREVVSFEQIQKEIPKEKLLARTADFDQILSALSLIPEESFIASRFEASRSISVDELCLLTGFPEEKVIRFVYVLIKMRAAQFRGEAARRPAVQKAEEADYNSRIAEQFYQLARQELDAGHFWKVTELCKQSLRNDIPRARYYELMAKAYAHHPRFLNDAEQCFYKAIELEPKDTMHRIALARFLVAQGLQQRALDECNLALEIDPNLQEALDLQQQLTQKPPETPQAS